jgi:hypothetical protein
MYAYDQDTRRLIAAEHVEQLRLDAAPGTARGRRRRSLSLREAAHELLAALHRAPKRSATA